MSISPTHWAPHPAQPFSRQKLAATCSIRRPMEMHEFCQVRDFSYQESHANLNAHCVKTLSWTWFYTVQVRDFSLCVWQLQAHLPTRQEPSLTYWPAQRTYCTQPPGSVTQVWPPSILGRYAEISTCWHIKRPQDLENTQVEEKMFAFKGDKFKITSPVPQDNSFEFFMVKTRTPRILHAKSLKFWIQDPSHHVYVCLWTWASGGGHGDIILPPRTIISTYQCPFQFNLLKIAGQSYGGECNGAMSSIHRDP